MIRLKHLTLLFTIVFITACATKKLQISENSKKSSKPTKKEVSHTFYLIGDAGNTSLGNTTPALDALSNELSKASKEATVLFLGDNVYPKGLDKKSAESKHKLQVQIDAVKNFKGKTIFLPGNHDWYSGLDALKDQEKAVEKALGKNSFLPEKGCPLDKVNITDDIVLITIDTHWYLTNWDKHPKINDNCEIKTRKKFFDELEGMIKKAQGKTAIIALHHPMFTYGPHGGKYSFSSHLKPLPVLGTLKNVLRKTTGVSNADLQNKQYNDLKKHIVTLAQQAEKAIFVSGHEHSLQYIVEDNIPQIVSGSGSKENETKLGGGAMFTYGKQGFAKLTVYKDGSSYVEFIDAATQGIVYEQHVLTANNMQTLIAYPEHFPATATASVYDKSKIKKGGLYKFFWGDRYRKYFGTDVTVPTVKLDTLFGGLTPVRKGGGHQSKSLRMVSKDGNEYVMRAIKKNAVQYLQTVLFKDQYIKGQFDNTATEDLLMDVFAGAHPFAPFVVGELSDAVDIYHTNPTLYYIPKQTALGVFNKEFGDELYMIEERTTDGHGDQKSFGYSNNLISTDDMIKNTTADDDYKVDEASYLRARLFDMLIGDWDRHDDQWRWAEFKEGKKTIYKPVPRDRDQAFSIMGDGFLLGFASKASTDVALFQSFDTDLKNPGGFNIEPYPLDVNILAESTKEDWDKQVAILQKGITDEVIDRAFALMPKEVQDETVDNIKHLLKGRRKNLQKIADKYYEHVAKYQVVKGSDKDNLFEIERLSNGRTKVSVYNIKKGKKGSQFHEKTYHKNDTKEIWIYGLDEDDVFIVKGSGDTSIKLRLVGGQNKDTYTIENGSNVVVYDYKSKKSVFTTNKGRKKLRDDYENNIFDFKKPKNTSKSLFPALASNPDDGFAIGISQVTTKYGFERNPFSYKHTLNANYFTATSGFNVGYVGEFANAVGSWNLGIDALYSNPNYAINFFGFGNETYNPEDDFSNNDDGLNYNRVRLQQIRFAPSIIKRGQLGSEFRLGASYESIEVENTTGRYINTDPNIPSRVFNSQNFIGTEISYHFLNTDNSAFSTMGMETNIVAGYKSNISESTGYGYLTPSISFNYKLINSGDIVFATKFAGHVNFGDDYEFYQAANIGANNGLRGYRNQRFTGKSAYLQSTDLRFMLNQSRTALAPVYFGMYAGFDYGKVWHPNTPTGDWNTSYGGGIFINAANYITGNISAFNGDDGVRIAFRIGFGF